MKVLFINPDWMESVSKKGKRINRSFPPLDILNAAALLLKEGIEVEIYDNIQRKNAGSEVASYSKNFDIVFITSSPHHRWQCPNLDFEKFVNFLKPFDKSNIFLYGSQCSIYPQEILSLIQCKGVIRGEPEFTIKDICTNTDLNNIKGLTYFDKDNKIVTNPDRELTSLDLFPTPAYELVNTNDYAYELLGRNLAVFEGSRGCPYKCIFCLQVMFNNKYGKKSAEKLNKEIDEVYEKTKFKYAYFYDLEFTVNKNLVREVCNHIIKKGYKFDWACQARFDTIDEDLLKLMKKANCKVIHYGIESGSDRILELINKKISKKDIYDGIKLTRKAGIESVCFFTFGFPSETKEEFEQTINFAIELNPTYVSFHVVSPYPGTKLFEMLKESEHKAESTEQETKNKIFFPEVFYTEFKLEDLEKVARKAFMRFYLRPYYILDRIIHGNPKSWWRQFKLFLDFLK